MGGFMFVRLPPKKAVEFIREHHYSRSCHPNPITFGIVTEGGIEAVICYSVPGSQATRLALWAAGAPYTADAVWELSRMVRIPGKSTCQLSQFLAWSLREFGRLRPEVVAVLTYADQTEGHSGAIYKAANFIQIGTTKARYFYRDADGRLRHPRQGGRNVTASVAAALGWRREKRLSKRRFVFLLGGRKAKAEAARHLAAV